MDARSANLCNTLVGNSITSGIMEMTLIGPEIRFDEFAQIAICGAEMAPLLNGEPCAMNRRLTIQAGSILKFGKATRGCRAYLAIAGGIEMIMKEFLPDRRDPVCKFRSCA
jgi:allophanate hydrolase subunit 2